MGRTYKRNDLYSSNRAKSIREKRNNSRSNKARFDDTNSSADYTTKYNKPAHSIKRKSNKEF